MIELNKIYNEDCLEGMKRIPDKSVDMILTDIPYGEVSDKGSERSKYCGQLRTLDKGVADEMNFEISEFLEGLTRISNGGIYIFCGIGQVSEIYTYFKDKKDFMVRQCAWYKSNPSPMNGQHMWLSSMENCIFAKRRKTKFNAKTSSSVWKFPVGRSKIHPTEKPVNLFTYLIESSSDEGDVVFDPCMGSGTTAIACTNTNRNYIGFELDETYFNLANERIANHLLERSGD